MTLEAIYSTACAVSYQTINNGFKYIKLTLKKINMICDVQSGTDI